MITLSFPAMLQPHIRMRSAGSPAVGSVSINGIEFAPEHLALRSVLLSYCPPVKWFMLRMNPSQPVRWCGARLKLTYIVRFPINSHFMMSLGVSFNGKIASYESFVNPAFVLSRGCFLKVKHMLLLEQQFKDK